MFENKDKFIYVLFPHFVAGLTFCHCCEYVRCQGEGTPLNLLDHVSALLNFCGTKNKDKN